MLGLRDLADDTLEIFTVYAQTREPSANDASPAVRRALAWLDASAGGGASAASANAREALQGISHAGTVIRLRACLTRERARRCRESVQRITGDSRQPFLVMVWQ